MESFLDYVVRSLVDHPEEVEIRPQTEGETTCYWIHVNPADIGKLIGRQGVTIQAIRNLFQVGAAKQNLHATVEIHDERPRPPRNDSGGRRRR